MCFLKSEALAYTSSNTGMLSLIVHLALRTCSHLKLPCPPTMRTSNTTNYQSAFSHSATQPIMTSLQNTKPPWCAALSLLCRMWYPCASYLYNQTQNETQKRHRETKKKVLEKYQKRASADPPLRERVRIRFQQRST